MEKKHAKGPEPAEEWEWIEIDAEGHPKHSNSGKAKDPNLKRWAGELTPRHAPERTGKEDSMSRPVPDKPGEKEDPIYNAIIIACVIGIVIVLGLILTARPQEGFTELYLLNYTEQPADGKLYVRYGISNHEGQEVSYKLSFRVDNETASEWRTKLRNNGTEEKDTYLQFNLTGTHKVMLEASFLNQTQEVHFWTR